MLGGLHIFGPGGYADTPLGSVLPIKMNRLERQSSDSSAGNSASSDLQLSGSIVMRPAAQGLRHFAMMLGATPDESSAIWAKLPPLEGANKFTGLSPAAIELASDGKNPLLVAQSFGNGRTMAFAGDTTWRWWAHGFADAHKRFWRQIVLWLARKDSGVEGNVWVRFQQRRLAPAQRVEFVVGAQTPGGKPLSGFTAEAEVQLPDGSRRTAQLIRQEDLMTGSFHDTQLPGDYTLTVIAKQGQEVLGTAQSRFLVFPQDLELDNPAADIPLMESLAISTGGQRLEPEQLPELLRRLTKGDESLLIRQETKLLLWDTWPFFLALVCLLGMEWFWRKRWGLV